MKIRATKLDSDVCSMAARALRGEQNSEMALGAVIALIVLDILKRHGQQEVHTDDLYPMLEEITQETDLDDPRAPPRSEKLFEELISKHLEKILERRAYGTPIANL